MIRYALRCGAGHDFDSWFRNAAGFDALKAAHQVTCPECGSTDVDKAPMAPRLAGRDPAIAPRPDGPEQRRAAALAELRAHVEANSDYVGVKFASEARRIHSGEAPARAIHGETRIDEARALLEEGVPIAPLPFVSRRKAN